MNLKTTLVGYDLTIGIRLNLGSGINGCKMSGLGASKAHTTAQWGPVNPVTRCCCCSLQ